MKAIILAGGGGTRLWPLSTEEKPKQFLSINNDKPLLINTIDRLKDFCNYEDVVVVTSQKYMTITKNYLDKYDMSNVSVLGEPERKNTAPAIALALVYMKEKLGLSNQESIFVFPSDHIIEPRNLFNDSINSAAIEIEKNRIVIFGIKPLHAETGYGYIESKNMFNCVSNVECFHEKPDLKTAEEYVKSKNYYWNSGIYGFNFSTFKNEIEKYNKNIYVLLEKSYDEILKNYASICSISIDYALSEKTKNISMVQMQSNWIDIGSWDSYYDFCKKDENGNVIIGNVSLYECKNSLIISDKKVVLSNLSDIIYVSNKDNCVVLKRGLSQNIKNVKTC